jgi:nucleotide-binding universal stress UspA family protein
MKPIMLATDGSPSAEAATREAIDLAKHLGVPLLAVSVEHNSVPAYGYYGYAEVVTEMRKVEHERVEKLLEALHDRATNAGVECVTLPLEGLPAQVICETAIERDVRLIIIGAHGWNRIGRLIHGSVSTYVLHHAPVPVLVVHGDDDAAIEETQAETTTVAVGASSIGATTCGSV